MKLIATLLIILFSTTIYAQIPKDKVKCVKVIKDTNHVVFKCEDDKQICTIAIEVFNPTLDKE